MKFKIFALTLRLILITIVFLLLFNLISVSRNGGLKTLVLFCNPRIIEDFENPDYSIKKFFEHYDDLFENFEKIILIFATANSDHILQYRGREYWDDKVNWARYISCSLGGGRLKIISEQSLNYQQIYKIVKKFKSEAKKRDYNFKIFDMIASTFEFAETNFRVNRHPETRKDSMTYNIMVSLKEDKYIYAAYPDGISEGKNAGEFLVEQSVAYIMDLGFDGILYDNQLGTRARWYPEYGPGFSEYESKAILDFLRYSRKLFGNNKIMWFDSYDPIEIEEEYYSFPREGYKYFDYIVIAGFPAISSPNRYLRNIKSKITLSDVTKLLASLCYVDPWYDYNSMHKYPKESKKLEEISIFYFDEIDGFIMFGNDEYGNFIPAGIIGSFINKLSNTLNNKN